MTELQRTAAYNETRTFQSLSLEDSVVARREIQLQTYVYSQQARYFIPGFIVEEKDRDNAYNATLIYHQAPMITSTETHEANDVGTASGVVRKRLGEIIEGYDQVCIEFRYSEESAFKRRQYLYSNPFVVSNRDLFKVFKEGGTLIKEYGVALLRRLINSFILASCLSGSDELKNLRRDEPKEIDLSQSFAHFRIESEFREFLIGNEDARVELIAVLSELFPLLKEDVWEGQLLADNGWEGLLLKSLSRYGRNPNVCLRKCHERKRQKTAGSGETNDDGTASGGVQEREGLNKMVDGYKLFIGKNTGPSEKRKFIYNNPFISSNVVLLNAIKSEGELYNLYGIKGLR